MSDQHKRRGGWRNPASAENGRKSTGGGRPRVRAEFRRGETLIVERQSLAPILRQPMSRPEIGTVLNVSANEIEIQIGEDILTLRRPDPDE
jgi:hypothetical protein